MLSASASPPRGRPPRSGPPPRAPRRQPVEVAQDADRDALRRAARCTSRAMYSSSRLISAVDLVGRALPVLLAEGEEGQHLDAGARGSPRPPRAPPPCRPGARAGRGSARPCGPAAVAVHDDGDVRRDRARAGGSAASSVVAHPSDFHDLRFFGLDQLVDLLDVLVGELLDVLLGARLVVLGDVLELLDLATASRCGACRTATRPSSASLCTTLTSSLRRSSESAGSGTRIRLPCVDGIEAEVGVADGLLDGLASAPLSNGCTVSSRGSGAATIATWLSGTVLP